MKVRIKFSKEGPVRFIGHLDIMRYFQKAIRRAGIDIAYSTGFSPHQIMSFASPLSVGHESCGEYFDVELNSITDTEDIKMRLNQTMAEGIQILQVAVLDAVLFEQFLDLRTFRGGNVGDDEVLVRGEAEVAIVDLRDLAETRAQRIGRSIEHPAALDEEREM